MFNYYPNLKAGKTPLYFNGNEQNVIDCFLSVCKDIVNNQGGYSQLSCQKEQVINTVLCFFKRNEYDQKYVLKIIESCYGITSSILDPIMSQGGRPFGWPEYHELRLKEEINMALQKA